MSDTTTERPSSDQGAFRPYAGVLAECHELLRNRACTTLSSLRQALVDELDARIQSSPTPEDTQVFIDLQRQLARGDEALEQAFASAFDHAFRELTRKRPAAQAPLYGAQTNAPMELSLVDDDAYSEALTVKGQANVLRGAAESELKDLEPRVAMMLGIDEFDSATNPVGPESVSEALKEACWSIQAPREAKALLFELLARRLAPELATLYRDVNQHLVARRIQPRVRHAVRRGGIEDKRPRRRHEPPADGDAADMLRQILTPREGQEFSRSTLGAPAPSTELMTLLTRLQQGEKEVTLGADRFAVDAGALGPVNILHGLVDAGLGKHGGSVDNIVIDVVATVFDFIFDDDRVPEAMKGLIGRLQLPVLKLALADHGFFSNRQHPARRLISALAQAASTWDGEFSVDTALYKVAEPLVLRIQNEACEDHSVFTACLEQFEAWLAEQDSTIDRKSAALTSQLEKKERQEIARGVALGVLAAHVGDATLPESVRKFLSEAWVVVLTRAALDGGEDGTAWRGAVETMNDLVWSVQPKTVAEDRQRLVKLLPGLLRSLRTALDEAKVGPESRDGFFSDLVKLHAAAVKSGMSAPQSPAAQASASTSAAAPARQAEEIATEPEPLELDHLKRGTWVELRPATGNPLAVRLTWISPARTMFLFANRQGQRALALTRVELARKFLNGEAALFDDEPFLDRIVSDVLDDYRPAGQAAQ